jgi:hypothetical protein
LENTSLKPFLDIVFENAKQFLEQPETIRISRNDGSLEFLQILPEILRQAKCHFKIDGSQSALLKGKELETIVQFINLVEGNPQIATQVNLMELYRKIYRRLGFKDEEEIFASSSHSNSKSPNGGELNGP